MTGLTETWALTNVTYEQATVVWKGSRLAAVVRRTEQSKFTTGDNERPMQISLDVFAHYRENAKPTFRLEARGDSLRLHETFYEVATSLGLERRTALFDLDTQKQFLAAGETWKRVTVPNSPLEAFIGYDLVGAGGVHGKLALATRQGTLSEVTFTMQNEAAESAWPADIELVPVAKNDRPDRDGLVLFSQQKPPALSGFTVRLTFPSGKTVDLPVVDGKLGGAAKTTRPVP